MFWKRKKNEAINKNKILSSFKVLIIFTFLGGVLIPVQQAICHTYVMLLIPWLAIWTKDLDVYLDYFVLFTNMTVLFDIDVHWYINIKILSSFNVLIIFTFLVRILIPMYNRSYVIQFVLKFCLVLYFLFVFDISNVWLNACAPGSKSMLVLRE